MLECFGLTHKILSFNGNNASTNDTQAVELAQKDNSFSEENRIHCFNHTMQLSARTLLKPFNKAMSSDRDPVDLPVADDSVSEDDKDGDGFLHLEDELAEEDPDVGEDDDVDETDELEIDEEEHKILLEEMTVVRETVAKVRIMSSAVPSIAQMSHRQLRKLSFTIINSSTLALPGWRRACASHNLAPNLIPHDVTTRWNSTYDMLVFVLRYHPAIDTITADKNLKLRKFELDDDEWKIVGDLVSVLEVCALPCNLKSPLILAPEI
jgi:hypothetical protein